MARVNRIKRRILREAVQENVDIMVGRTPLKRRRPLGVLARAARLFFFIAVPIAVFTSSYLLATIADETWDLGRRAAAPAEGPVRRPAPVLAVPASHERAVVAIPERIDPAVFPVAVRKVVIDPGHGGDNLGTTGPGGLVEKELTLDIAERLRELLEESAFHVVMTRTEDAELSLEERAREANESQGDIFVSIHVNWLETKQVRGVETYYLGATDDPYLTALAASENQGSGYSLADLRDLIEEVYANARQEESQRLASEVQHALYRSLRARDDDLQDRGVKTAPFGVLIRTGMPAILAEVACLSNEEEARLLMTAEYRQHIAEALHAGIESYSQRLSQRSQIGS